MYFINLPAKDINIWNMALNGCEEDVIREAERSEIKEC